MCNESISKFLACDIPILEECEIFGQSLCGNLIRLSCLDHFVNQYAHHLHRAECVCEPRVVGIRKSERCKSQLANMPKARQHGCLKESSNHSFGDGLWSAE